jgi:biopolymer transport protein ExbB
LLRIITETWALGGPVLFPIFLAGLWGFFLVFRTYAELGSSVVKTDLVPRFDALRQQLVKGQEAEARRIALAMPSLIRHGILTALENRHLSESALRNLLAEKLSYSLFRLEKHLPMIRSLAAASPLLGLLGTVSGLIHTFQIMTEHGSSNSQLLALGISEALIATQTGLFLAIALILLGQRLEGRIIWLKQQVEYGVTRLLNQFYAPDGAKAE